MVVRCCILFVLVPCKQKFKANVRLNAFADDHSLNYTFKANNREQEVDTMNSLEQC